MMQEWLPMIEQYQQEEFFQPYGMDTNGSSQYVHNDTIDKKQKKVNSLMLL